MKSNWCLLRTTKNVNESLNGVVWSRCQENMNYGAKAAQCAEATEKPLQFHEVAISTEKIMTKLSIPCGECTKKSSTAKSKKRLFKPTPASNKKRRDFLRDQSMIRIVWSNRELSIRH